MVAILMMLAKLATLHLPKIKVLWNMTFVHDVTTKILLLDSNYVVDTFIWPNFGNSSV